MAKYSGNSRKANVKADKSIDDWVIAMFCDYGDKRTRRMIRASYSAQSAANSWNKLYKSFSKNGYRCWQEDKFGTIVRDSSKLKVG